jgi:mannose-1-phosphate guanylyltransferase
MKALLLAAGLGTRLRPITDEIPKCLVKLNGKPLLYYWLDILETARVEEVVINTHHFASKVEKTIRERNNRINISLAYEKVLLGSGGTVMVNKKYFRDDDFLLIYSDNYTCLSLNDLIDFHKSKKDSLYTTYIYKTPNPGKKGIFTFDPVTFRVTDFEEKPLSPKSDYANAGIAVVSKKVYSFDYKTPPFDFAKDIMPYLIQCSYVLPAGEPIIDIGTKEDYFYVQNLIKSL